MNNDQIKYDSSKLAAYLYCSIFIVHFSLFNKVIYTVIILITAYYSIITIFNLCFLIPLIIFWAIGVEDIEFFNTLQFDFMPRTDISYFTSGDIAESIELLLIIIALIVITKGLWKLIKKNKFRINFILKQS